MKIAKKKQLGIVVFIILMVNIMLIPMFRNKLSKIENQATATLVYKQDSKVKIFNTCVAVYGEETIAFFDKKNGQKLWEFEYVSDVITGRFSVMNNALFMLNEKHAFTKINFSTGEQEWLHQFQDSLSKDNKMIDAKERILVTFQYEKDSTEFHIFDTKDGRLLDTIIYGKQRQKFNFIKPDVFLKQDLDWSKLYYFDEPKIVYDASTRKIYFLKSNLNKTAHHLVAKKQTAEYLYIYKRSLRPNKKKNFQLDSIKIESKFTPVINAVTKNYLLVETSRASTGRHAFVYSMNDFKEEWPEINLGPKCITSDGFSIIEIKGREVIFKNIKTQKERSLFLPKGVEVESTTIADENYLHLKVRKKTKKDKQPQKVTKEDKHYLELIEKKHGNFDNEIMYIIPLNFMEK